MNTGIAIIVGFLVLIFVLGFPTRERMRKALTPAPGPHPIRRPFIAANKRYQRWKRKRRSRHLKGL